MDGRMDALVSDPETWRVTVFDYCGCTCAVPDSELSSLLWEGRGGCGSLVWIWERVNGTVKGCLHCQEDEGTCLVPRICD